MFWYVSAGCTMVSLQRARLKDSDDVVCCVHFELVHSSLWEGVSLRASVRLTFSESIRFE